MEPEILTRPNGKPYRPRVVRAHVVLDDDAILGGVIVTGTHHAAGAQLLADNLVSREDYGYVAASPVTGWYRLGMYAGNQMWQDDPVHGAAGVWFREITEA